MAKRGGKAVTRRQRQRAANRPAPRTAPPQPAATSSSAASEPARVEPVTASASPAASTIPTTPARRRATTIAADLYGSSRLSEKAAAEYHYVVADLRNIVVLSAVLAGLLALAFVLVNVLGIGKVV